MDVFLFRLLYVRDILLPFVEIRTCRVVISNFIHVIVALPQQDAYYVPRLGPQITISSKYTRYLKPCIPANIMFISLRNVAGAFLNPNGIRLNS